MPLKLGGYWKEFAATHWLLLSYSSYIYYTIFSPILIHYHSHFILVCMPWCSNLDGLNEVYHRDMTWGNDCWMLVEFTKQIWHLNKIQGSTYPPARRPGASKTVHRASRFGQIFLLHHIWSGIEKTNPNFESRASEYFEKRWALKLSMLWF